MRKLELRAYGVGCLVLTILLVGCRAPAPGPAAGGSRATDASTADRGPAMRFKRHSAADTQGLGGEAFSILVPVDWVFEGGVSWRLDNPAFPGYGTARVRNPRGAEEFEIFPNLPFFWTDNRMLLSTFPQGSKYFGNLVRPPAASAAQALQEIVVPTFRGHARGLRVIEAGPVAELARAVGQMQARSQPGVTMQADAARVRIEYDGADGTVQEEIYGVVQGLPFPVLTPQGTITNLNWWVDYLFSFKAPKGRLEQAAPVLQTIAFSFRLNPAWFDRYTKLVEFLIRNQIRQIRATGEIGRMIAQTGSEMREENLRRWEQDQAIRDRLNENFSDSIRGVERYYNPYDEKVVELPAGYDNVWVNRLGEVVLSESPSYNPNVGSNLDWQRLERRK